MMLKCSVTQIILTLVKEKTIASISLLKTRILTVLAMGKIIINIKNFAARNIMY